MADDLSGAVLDGRYRVIEQIAAGAMGVVYRAERVKLGRIVAIKVLHDELPTEISGRKRFEIEAVAMAKLEHPHCAAVLDVGIHEDKPYVVMDFVSGPNLKDVITEGPLPIVRAVEIVRQVLSGLAHAHEHGIIHRDVKPANIILSQKAGLGDHVKILDFGLARLNADASNLTTGIVVGTPSYMAPEQIRGVAIDHRADLYACGILLFELLTGKKPFHSAKDDPIEVCSMHLKNAPPKLADMQPGIVFGELEAVLAKALAKAPADRYATAEEFAAALDIVPRRRIATPVAGVAIPPTVVATASGWAVPSDSSVAASQSAIPASGPTAAPASGPTVAPASGPIVAQASGPTAAPASGPDGPTAASASGPGAASPGTSTTPGYTVPTATAAPTTAPRAVTAPATLPNGSAPAAAIGSAPSPARAASEPASPTVFVPDVPPARSGLPTSFDLSIAIPREKTTPGEPTPGFDLALGAAHASEAPILETPPPRPMTMAFLGAPPAGPSPLAATDLPPSAEPVMVPKAPLPPIIPLTRKQLVIGGGGLLGLVVVIAIIATATGASNKDSSAVTDAVTTPPPPPPRGPDSVQEQIDRATALVDQGKLEAAIEHLLASRRVFPADARLAYMTGKLYFAKLWWPAGLKQFRDAVRLDPAFRADPELIKTVLKGFLTPAEYNNDLGTFLRSDIGAPAKPYLEETAQTHPRASTRARAAAELKKIP